MWKSKDVYYISGNTGILAKDMGKALLCQFPEISFNEELIPFIRSESQARRALDKILAAIERPLSAGVLHPPQHQTQSDLRYP